MTSFPDGFADPAAAARMAARLRAYRERVEAGERAEKLLSKILPVVDRQIKPLAQLINEAFNRLSPDNLPAVQGCAALQVRNLRRRRRTARQELLQHSGLSQDQAVKSQNLTLQEGDPSCEIVIHVSSSIRSNALEATSAEPAAHRLSDEPSQT